MGSQLSQGRATGSRRIADEAVLLPSHRAGDCGASASAGRCRGLVFQAVGERGGARSYPRRPVSVSSKPGSRPGTAGAEVGAADEGDIDKVIMTDPVDAFGCGSARIGPVALVTARPARTSPRRRSPAPIGCSLSAGLLRRHRRTQLSTRRHRAGRLSGRWSHLLTGAVRSR